ncbi:MAG: potassium transporter [Gammaproteobacteria bacterium]|nr:potassium transporter [Gammaproteobacteria bacterium]NIM75025.1 potassium transporter [Gammaproteobacteria bacterium]NIN40075.1 potassium transporter [Gammaproteobacteria bacterium]NIO26562.1 potassium transporter [Gammaproteobacteria bacterium]NIO67114.1 potassium transporter [Gammaproteobacteria bacterium]
MQLFVVQRILGLLLCLFSISMLPPMLVSWWYDDGAFNGFLDAFLVILVSGLALWLPVRRHRRELRLRDGFVIVFMFWVALGLSGSLPLLVSKIADMSVTDAVFESISGLTTTGATVIENIDALPHSILFYRQQLQWLGGMGIIVLAVAILPMLGVGGMQLYRAETPGPMKDNKLTPRITETAKALWYIYLGLTIVCALAYWLAGMGPFDAVSHSFSTVAIGGFSTHDASLGYFDNPWVEAVAVVFMTIAGINFAIHFLAFRSRSPRPYLGDTELKTYVVLLICVSLISSLYLFYSETFPTFASALRHGIFQSVSISTTSGFTTSGYYTWPSFLPVMLLFASFVGGCAGSTGGGLKVIRVVLLYKQGKREIMRLIHPNAQVPIKINGASMPSRVVDAVWGFFATYVATFSFMMLALLALGLDQVTAFSAVAACINNLGPGLGSVGANYAELSDGAKWILSLAMLLGRLEIFTLLVILTPSFWRG